MPEVASLPLQLIVTGFRYQPFASGERAVFAVMPVGAWLSTLIGLVVTEICELSTSVAVQVLEVPVVGPSILTANSQPEVEAIWDAGSVTAQCRTTYSPPELPRYHPFVPEIPVMVYKMEGEATSSGLGFADGASHISPRIATDGGKSRLARRSHDVSLETTDPLHGRGTTRPGSYSFVARVTPPLSAPGG
jgi:hypothetical protein